MQEAFPPSAANGLLGILDLPFAASLLRGLPTSTSSGIPLLRESIFGISYYFYGGRLVELWGTDALFTARFDGHKSSLAGARNVEVRRVAVAAGEELKRAKKALGPTRARQARANAASAAELQERHSPEPKHSVGTRGRTGEHRHAPHPSGAASCSVQACQTRTWRRLTQWNATHTSYTKR